MLSPDSDALDELPSLSASERYLAQIVSGVAPDVDSMCLECMCCDSARVPIVSALGSEEQIGGDYVVTNLVGTGRSDSNPTGSDVSLPSKPRCMCHLTQA